MRYLTFYIFYALTDTGENSYEIIFDRLDLILKISEVGYRWVPGTEQISKDRYRWVPGTEEILEIGYRWVPGTEEIFYFWRVQLLLILKDELPENLSNSLRF